MPESGVKIDSTNISPTGICFSIRLSQFSRRKATRLSVAKAADVPQLLGNCPPPPSREGSGLSVFIFACLFVCSFFPTGGNDPRTQRSSACCQRVRQHVNDLSGAGGGGPDGGVVNKRGIMTTKPGCPFSSGNFTASAVVNVQ